MSALHMLTFTILHLNVLILAALTFYHLCNTLDVLSVIYCNDCRHFTNYAIHWMCCQLCIAMTVDLLLVHLHFVSTFMWCNLSTLWTVMNHIMTFTFYVGLHNVLIFSWLPTCMSMCGRDWKPLLQLGIL